MQVDTRETVISLLMTESGKCLVWKKQKQAPQHNRKLYKKRVQNLYILSISYSTRSYFLSLTHWCISFPHSTWLPTLIIKKIQTSVWSFMRGTTSRCNHVSEGPFNRGVGRESGWYSAISGLSKYSWGGCEVNLAWTWNFNRNLMVVMEGKKKEPYSFGPPARNTWECTHNCKWICLSCMLVHIQMCGWPPESSECLIQCQMSLKHHYLDDGIKDVFEMQIKGMTCIFRTGINSILAGCMEQALCVWLRVSLCVWYEFLHGCVSACVLVCVLPLFS